MRYFCELIHCSHKSSAGRYLVAALQDKKCSNTKFDILDLDNAMMQAHKVQLTNKSFLR